MSAVLETLPDWLARNPTGTPDDFAAYLLRYCLSPKACRGILRRAKKRGRALPEALRLALEARASAEALTAPSGP